MLRSLLRIFLALCLFVSQAHAGSMTLLGVGSAGAAAVANPFALDGTLVSVNSGGSAALALPAYTSTFGNDVVLAFVVSNGLPITSITGGGLTWARVTGLSVPGNVDVWFAIAASPLAGVVFTVNTTSANFITASIQAVSGAKTSAPFDATSIASTTGGATYPTYNSSVANTIGFGTFSTSGSNTQAGWTALTTTNFQNVTFQKFTSIQSGNVWDNSNSNSASVLGVVKGP